MKKVTFDFDLGNFTAGFLVAAVTFAIWSGWYLLLLPLFLFKVEIDGMPFIDVSFRSGVGWKVKRGIRGRTPTEG